jgi:hypothetical protein
MPAQSRNEGLSHRSARHVADCSSLRNPVCDDAKAELVGARSMTTDDELRAMR